jgi:uncharacterized protein (TIGR01777 family)
MRIAITGASGLIGSALRRDLVDDGHEVLRLVRREARATDEVGWDPRAGTVDVSRLQSVDAVVHLAAAGIGDHRWTEQHKQEIHDSRVLGTRTISAALASMTDGPRVLVSGSAIGYYGDTGDRAVTEDAPLGHGFFAEVVRDWEAATKPASDAGIRVAISRSGLVVSPRGGAWGRMWPLFKLGLGGRLGSGRQYWSWISLRDEVRALRFLIENDALSGPVNLTAPFPATNADVTAAMGTALHRPTLFPVPAFALRTVLGELSSEVLGSIRVLPQRLTDAGFTWLDPTIDDAVRTALAA